MNSRSLLTAIYTGFLVFSLLSLFFGTTGISSMEKLNDRKMAVNANLESLESRQDDLKSTLSSLRSDRDAIMVEARSLGLYRDADDVVLFGGSDRVKPRYDAGKVLRLEPMKQSGEGFLRMAALGAAIIAILISLVTWRVRDADTKRA